MKVVSVRVPEKLREEMRKLNVEWADFFREAIAEKVKKEKMKQACQAMDEVRRKTEGVPFDSTRVIREAREQR